MGDLYLKRSCPAVSQICSLTVLPPTLTTLDPNSTPMVWLESCLTAQAETNKIKKIEREATNITALFVYVSFFIKMSVFTDGCFVKDSLKSNQMYLSHTHG